MASDIMEGGVSSRSGDAHEGMKPQATAAAANSTSGSWRNVRRNSWETGRGEDIGTGGGSAGLGRYEGEPLLREEVRTSTG